MVKGIQTTVNILKKATTPTQAARKVSSAVQQPIIVTNPIGQVTNIVAQKQAKLKSLLSRFSTDTKKLRINGVEKEITYFKGSQGGSNPGGWVYNPTTDALGYAKFGGEAQMRSEKLASELYQIAGAKTPKITLATKITPAKSRFGQKTENVGIISSYLPSEKPTSEQIKLLREDFGADCWLANWDALKQGNVGIVNGQPVRMDVGGSLCYRAQGARKGANFGDEVQELTTFFDNYSLSKPYLRDMSREELLRSLKKVSQVTDDDVIKIVDDNAYSMAHGPYRISANQVGYGLRRVNNGVKNPEFMKETLIARKRYITEFLKKCEATPQRQGETIETYIRRIAGEMPKTSHKIPYEKLTLSSRVGQEVKGLTMAETLTPSQKKLYDEAYEAFMMSKGKQIVHENVDDIISTDCMVHATDSGALKNILKEGFTPSEFRSLSSSGTKQETLTPLSSDFWDVKARTSIKDYFSRRPSQCADGELRFLPNTNCDGGSNVVLVVNKQKVDKNLMKNSFLAPDVESSVLSKDGIVSPHTRYSTHRVVPFGVPSNAIDRVIVKDGRYSSSEVQDIIKTIQESGLDIKLYDTNGKLLWQPIKKTVDIMKNNRFGLYGRHGIPLKYSRAQFRNDVWNLIDREVPVDKRTGFLARFHLTAGQNGVLDGAPVIKGFKPRTETERKMLHLIEKFYQNETDISGYPEAKKALDKILKIHPEFAMMVGKPQHGTHAYSVDIHTLELFRKALNNSAYSSLSEEGKLVLKHAAIMHDYGKLGEVITPGHAKLSRAYAEKVLSTYDGMPDTMKKRILNMIENHHWFEGYNKGIMSAEDFAKIFPSFEDKQIAIILAKADFEAVNPTFHLDRLVKGKHLTEEQYEKTFNSIITNLIRKSYGL